MKPHHRYALAAVLLLAGFGGAWAGDTGSALKASDWLVLTGSQEQMIWQSVSGQNTRDMAAPSVFEPSVGAMVPASVALRAWPSKVTGRIPAVRPYAYAVLDTKVLIVNPTNKKIVDVIRH